jgi:hypothetical protein
MPAYGHALVFVTTLIVFFFVLWLVRRRSIGERFAVLWLLLSGFLLLLSSVAYPYLFQIAKYVGVPYPPSALFFLAISGLTLLIIELFAWVSKLNDRTRTLTQELAILRERFDVQHTTPEVDRGSSEGLPKTAT